MIGSRTKALGTAAIASLTTLLYTLPVWAGVVPLRLRAALPLQDPRLANGMPVPGYVRGFHANGEES